MGFVQRKVGSLECVIREPSSTPRAIASFCHGFGAPSTDLVPVGGELEMYSKLVQAHTLMVFPAAPIELKEFGYGARCWWPIRFQDLQQAMFTGDYTQFKAFVPPQMEEMSARLSETIDLLAQQYNIPASRCTLGGFSQGAMVSTNTIMTSAARYGGLLIWSGTLLSIDTWRTQAREKSSLPVFQSHGTFDEILPFSLASELKALLEDSGLDVEFHSFPQGHTIPDEIIERSAKFLERFCEGTDSE